jgi:hypothetical protein
VAGLAASLCSVAGLVLLRRTGEPTDDTDDVAGAVVEEPSRA